MKKFLVALTLLVGCGVDKVEVNCPESACIEIPDPTTEPVVAPRPTVAPVEPVVVTGPVLDPSISPARDVSYQIKFVYKVTSRRTMATDFCANGEITSILSEGDLPSWKWECFVGVAEGWVGLEIPQERSFQAKNSLESRTVAVLAIVYESYMAKSGCTASSENSLTCQITDNYIEMFAPSVVDRDEKVNQFDYKTHTNVLWKVFYHPSLGF